VLETQERSRIQGIHSDEMWELNPEVPDSHWGYSKMFFCETISLCMTRINSDHINCSRLSIVSSLLTYSMFYIQSLIKSDQDMKWVSSSVFINHKVHILRIISLMHLFRGSLFHFFCPCFLSLMCVEKYIDDSKDRLLYYEYATWLQGHQFNLKKVYLNSELDWLSLCVAALHNMA
jgi:hypothetical protein